MVLRRLRQDRDYKGIIEYLKLKVPSDRKLTDLLYGYVFDGSVSQDKYDLIEAIINLNKFDVNDYIIESAVRHPEYDTLIFNLLNKKYRLSYGSQQTIGLERDYQSIIKFDDTIGLDYSIEGFIYWFMHNPTLTKDERKKLFIRAIDSKNKISWNMYILDYVEDENYDRENVVLLSLLHPYPPSNEDLELMEGEELQSYNMLKEFSQVTPSLFQLAYSSILFHEIDISSLSDTGILQHPIGYDFEAMYNRSLLED